MRQARLTAELAASACSSADAGMSGRRRAAVSASSGRGTPRRRRGYDGGELIVLLWRGRPGRAGGADEERRAGEERQNTVKHVDNNGYDIPPHGVPHSKPTLKG